MCTLNIDTLNRYQIKFYLISLLFQFTKKLLQDECKISPFTINTTLLTKRGALVHYFLVFHFLQKIFVNVRKKLERHLMWDFPFTSCSKIHSGNHSCTNSGIRHFLYLLFFQVITRLSNKSSICQVWMSTFNMRLPI